MRRFIFYILVTSLSSPLLFAQQRQPPPPTPPQLYASAIPNQTTIEQAIQRLGKPSFDHTAYFLEGTLNPFPLSGFNRASRVYAEAKRRGVNVVNARVLVWDVIMKGWDWEHVTYVFKDDRLWYAIYPVPPTESTPEQLTALYGGKPIHLVRNWSVIDHREAELFAYPERGVIYQRARGSRDRLADKIVFPPQSKMVPLWWPSGLKDGGATPHKRVSTR